MRRFPADRLLPVLGLAPLLVALALPATALARQDDRKQPMDLQSDRNSCNLANDNNPCWFDGNVVIVQGTLKITAAHADISRKGGQFSRVLLTGTPVVFTQTMDDGSVVNGRANKVDYDLNAEQAVFTGDVKMTQPRGTLEGQRVVYNTRTGEYTGGGDGHRVHMVIQPKPSTPSGKSN
jgi:lipopolysaccharide export system protein LptA